MFLNLYECTCGCHWEDEWDCSCNDRCPDCNKEIEPYNSIVLPEEEYFDPIIK